MDIQTIRSCIHNFEEAIFSGVEIDVAGTPVLLAAITREEKKVQLYLFAEGEDTNELQEKRMKIEKKRRRGTLTKREEMLEELQMQGNCLLNLVRGIRVAGTEYEFRTGNGSGLEEYNLEGRMLLYQFLYNHVPFGFLEEQNLSMIQYAAMELEGEYEKIPFSRKDLETLEFLSEPRHYRIPIKQKIKVSLGDQAGRERKFFCEELQREIPYYINSISLTDTLSTYEKKYGEMKAQGHFSEEEHEMFLGHLKEICPPGMRNLMIEYECEEAFLEFYAKEQLKEKVKINTGTAVALFLAGRAEKKEGMHGKRMKVCMIQYPVKPDIQEIELELLRAFVQEKTDS